jgi:hypothetical protein
MSVYLWNYRGLGNDAIVRELRDFAKEFAPSIFCVVETQIHKSRVEILASTLGYDNAFAVSSQGRSGGLGIFWNNEIKIDVLPYSQYHIDAVVTPSDMDPWRLTCVYGEAKANDRHKAWDMLKFIKASSPLPWLCIRDFNEVLHREEHMGVHERCNAQIQAFRETVDVCELMDLGFTGNPWTFERKVAGGTYCRVRLDRALATPGWSALFPLAVLEHLTAAASDHSPILLRFEPAVRDKIPRLFRYETMWESHAEFGSLMEQKWQGNTCLSMHELENRLRDISGDLTAWGRDTFGSVRRETRDLRNRLEVLRGRPDRLRPSHEELKIVERLMELNHREEVMWRQRARIQWLAEGDRNYRFFHLRASKRKKRNRIAKLRRANGSLSEDVQEMCSMAREFYKNLYSTEGTFGMDEVLNAVPVTVTQEMNERLIQPFDDTEVKQALFQMYPLKAPGPDGFPAHFFQKHWDLCGGEVTMAVLRILRGEDSPAGINQTFVVLMPKVASPEELGQFRTISLCNVIYKIASKVLANRLTPILPEIISEEQSAFVPGRLITDNIITAYECLHFMKRNDAKKHRHCALKLDMRKAYDQIEWSYLRAIMLRMGFHPRWVNLVMSLVSSVSFSVLFNGAPLESFKPSRGLRQGDPISPISF